MNYHRPVTLDDALAQRADGAWTVLAGGTDFYPSRVAKPLSEPVLDISALADLRGITPVLQPAGTGGRIGALTTWSDLVRHADAPVLRALVSAAREVGGIQIQNQGTVGGNLCNASPAADGVPALAALDARVELRSRRGLRSLPITDFVQGNRQTRLADDEILTALTLPAFSQRAVSQFRKLGHRKYLVISIVMVAVCLDFDPSGAVNRCGIAVGACAPSVRRLAALEAVLLGTQRRMLAARVEEWLGRADCLQELSPIDDLRGSADYRLQAVRELLVRVFAELLESTDAT